VYIRTVLKNQRMAPDAIDKLVEMWDYERLGRFKEPTVKLIMDWMANGIITAEQAFDRVVRCGYTKDDATRIVWTGQVKRGEKIESELGKMKREVRQVINDQRAAARATQRELTEREKQIAKEVERLNKEAERVRLELAQRAK